MTRRSVNLVEFWLRLAFFSIPAMAFGIAGYIRFRTGYFQTSDINIRSYWALSVFVTLLWALVIEHLKLDRIDSLLRMQTGIRMSLLATTYCTLLLLSGLFFYRTTLFARLFLGLGCSLMFLLSIAMMHLFRGVIYAVIRAPNGRFPIAIIGADDVAFGIARQLSCNPFAPCEVACFVALPGQVSRITDGRVLDWHQLDDVVQVYGCNEALLALSPERFGEAHQLLESLQRLSVPTKLVLHLGPTSLTPDRIFDFYGIPLMDVRAHPVESVRYALGKRIFDMAFAAVALLLTSPIMAAIALGIKLTSPGPVLFVQNRVGLNGRLFRMYKFRSMKVSDSAESDTRWTTPEDPRRTLIGSWLRKTSLDELPQFINVLKGDMSVVGPRPERPHFVKEFLNDISKYSNRHYLKVGITGWAQVNGWRGDTSIQKRLEFDLYYLRNWSIAFDCKIIFLTVLRGLSSSNAY